MESQEPKYEINDHSQRTAPSPARWAMPALAVLLAGAAVWSGFALSRERQQNSDLVRSNQELSGNLAEVQGQMRSISDRLSTMSAHMNSVQATASQPSPAEPALSSAPAPAPKPVYHRRAAVPPKPSQPVVLQDPRVDELQSKLNDQQQQIAGTRDQLDRTRSDIENRLNSTRDDLNGSISRTHDEVARNHDELVALEKRGQRSYYEFKLDKSKQFQRVGPLSLSLRKVNAKKKSYDLLLVVDDQQLQKKNVNLYEPVVLLTSDRGQRMEVVVNSISQSQVSGYISEPKYPKSELASSATPASVQPPALQQRLQ